MTARIALDVMGGDNAPHEIVAGALMAAGGLDVELLLVGRPGDAEAELRGTDTKRIRIVPASDVIGMDEHPTESVRGKPDASINVGLRLVKSGEADAFVTAGNTGATMAASLLTLGRVKGIARPALAILFPTGDSATLLLDVGANADWRPIQLVQFAHMGASYSQKMLNLPSPRVALLSIGEEDSKGSQEVIEVNQALRNSRLNFVGNIEGKDLLKGHAEVIVTDGFTGNVAIKLVEGMSDLMFGELRKVVELTPWNKAAGFILMSELRKVRRKLDYTEYGGAVLLGVDGLVVIGHGRSNARAVFSAIRAAKDAVERGVLGLVREVATEIPAKAPRSANGASASPGGDEDEE
jgi:glycerol-3-phosphate acyltransferase PlsX